MGEYYMKRKIVEIFAVIIILSSISAIGIQSSNSLTSIARASNLQIEVITGVQ